MSRKVTIKCCQGEDPGECQEDHRLGELWREVANSKGFVLMQVRNGRLAMLANVGGSSYLRDLDAG